MPNHNAHLAVAICTPLAKVTGPRGDLIFDPISPLWHRARMALSFGTNVNSSEICVDVAEIGDARSQVAARCLSMNPRPEYLLFIDSDVIVPSDSYLKLSHHVRTKPHIDVAAGIYVCKGAGPPWDPLIYRDPGEGAFWDWAVGDILTTKTHGIRATHMGLTLIRVSLFQRMLDAGVVHGDGTDQEDEPFFCTQRYTRDTPRGRETFSGTEDIYFYEKARKIPGECQILVDTSVLAGHHDKKTGISYGMSGNCSPVERAKWLPLPDGSGLRKDRKEATEAGKKLCLDLGAGESRREWPGYITYTLDSRPRAGVDYVQDLTQLNQPSDHWDRVASRHSFEHVGRWDQERLWSEVFRITKPGGDIEICVPNVEWAAEKIVAGEVDFHVLNVLYGSQEMEAEMGRDKNVHFFAYTPAIARALAEGCGLVNVVVKSYKDDPSLEYHLIVTGEKPLPVESSADNTPTVDASSTTTPTGAVEFDVAETPVQPVNRVLQLANGRG